MSYKKVSVALQAAAILVMASLLCAGASATTFKVLYKFRGTPDAQHPAAGLVLDGAGNLYGTTQFGGAWGFGAVYKLTASPDGTWTETVLYSFFGGEDGGEPTAALTFDAAGNLYGTASLGGISGNGVVFKLTPNPDGTWSQTVLNAFNGLNGSEPAAELTFDASGNLYGATPFGGAAGEGTVFRLTPNPDGSWSETVIYSFVAKGDGNPKSGLVFDADGNLYGTTMANLGRVFKLIPRPDQSWEKHDLHTFNEKDGVVPIAGLTFDNSGNLCGMASLGGPYNSGTVFKLTRHPDGHWKFNKIHAFKNRNYPTASLIVDAEGNLYGTTPNGGGRGGGLLFRLTRLPSGEWQFTKLHSFSGGESARSALTMDTAGNLYGTTYFGGNGFGEVYEVTP